jgi:hypothetical protein
MVGIEVLPGNDEGRNIVLHSIRVLIREGLMMIPKGFTVRIQSD